jgi:hypothetical protein
VTNGRGQVTTIRENIFRKYGRYQVHPPRKRKDDDENKQPDDPRIAVLKAVAPELFENVKEQH